MDGLVAKLRGDRKGVTALEYGLIAALVAAVIATAVAVVGTRANSAFARVGSSMSASAAR